MIHENEKNQGDGDKKNVLPLTINEKVYNWHHQYITGSKVRELGNIPKEDEIFLAIIRPWEDEIVMDDSNIDLARPGIEHFYSKKPGEIKMVTIHVNGDKRKITKGNHSVSEIKAIGEVPVLHELEEVIQGKLTPLADDAIVLIKGGEKFFSHVRDGSSS